MSPLRRTPHRSRENVERAQAMASVVLVAMMAVFEVLLLAKGVALVTALNRLSPWELARAMTGM